MSTSMSAAFARALADGEPATDARMSEIGDEIAARLGDEISATLRERLGALAAGPASCGDAPADSDARP